MGRALEPATTASLIEEAAAHGHTGGAAAGIIAAALEMAPAASSTPNRKVGEGVLSAALCVARLLCFV